MDWPSKLYCEKCKKFNFYEFALEKEELTEADRKNRVGPKITFYPRCGICGGIRMFKTQLVNVTITVQIKP